MGHSCFQCTLQKWTMLQPTTVDSFAKMRLCFRQKAMLSSLHECTSKPNVSSRHRALSHRIARLSNFRVWTSSYLDVAAASIASYLQHNGLNSHR